MPDPVDALKVVLTDLKGLGQWNDDADKALGDDKS